MQIKTTMRYPFIPIRMAKTKNTIARGGEDVEELDLAYPAGGNVKWYNYFGKQLGSS